MNFQQLGRAFRETGRKGPGAHKAPARLSRSPAATEGADRSQERQNRAEPGLQAVERVAPGRAGRCRQGSEKGGRAGPGRTRPHQRSRACSRRRPSRARHPRAPLGGRRGGGRGGGGSGGGARNREAVAAARRGREGASRSRAGPRKSNSDASSSSSASVSPLRRPERLLAAQPGCRLRPGRAAEVPGERPAPRAGHRGLRWVSVPGATGAFPHSLTLLLSPVAADGEPGMGTELFLACPHSSSRAPASSPFVCAAPRARGGARPCGGSGAAARPAWRAGSSWAGPRGRCTAPAWQEGPPPTSSRPCAHLPRAAAPVFTLLPCAVTGGGGRIRLLPFPVHPPSFLGLQGSAAGQVARDVILFYCCRGFAL